MQKVGAHSQQVKDNCENSIASKKPFSPRFHREGAR
jgi:hypothetical protein